MTKSEIDFAKAMASTELALDHSHSLSARDRSVRLLFWFQTDYLSTFQATILRAKFNRDHGVVFSVTSMWQTVTWVVLCLVNFWLLFYVVWFAARSSTVHMENAWARTFALWLSMEILVVESISTLLVHCLFPLMGGLGRVHQMKEALVGMLFSSSQSTDQGLFNAAKYTHVSYRVAREQSSLPAAELVLNSVSSSPREPRSNRSLLQWCMYPVYLVLGALSSMSLVFQSIVWYCVATLIMYYEVFYIVQIIDSSPSPALLVLPIVLFALFAVAIFFAFNSVVNWDVFQMAEESRGSNVQDEESSMVLLDDESAAKAVTFNESVAAADRSELDCVDEQNEETICPADVLVCSLEQKI
jgi:hypothetical protein